MQWLKRDWCSKTVKCEGGLNRKDGGSLEGESPQGILNAKNLK